MAPLTPAARQEVLRVTEVACTPESFVLRHGCAVSIRVESGPKQSFSIRSLDEPSGDVCYTPLIAAGHEYLWEPESEGRYRLQSEIFPSLRATVSVPSLTSATSALASNRTLSPASVDDRIDMPLFRNSLLGVSSRTASPSIQQLSNNSRQGSASPAAAFSLSSPNTLSQPRSSSSASAEDRLSMSSGAGNAYGSGAEEEEDDQEALAAEKHPSIGGMRRRRSSTHTESANDSLDLNSNNLVNSRSFNDMPRTSRATTRPLVLGRSATPDKTIDSISLAFMDTSSTRTAQHHGNAPIQLLSTNNLHTLRASPEDRRMPPRSLLACKVCDLKFLCAFNQRRCLATHIKRKKHTRQPLALVSSDMVAFWDKLDVSDRKKVFTVAIEEDGAVVLSRFGRAHDRFLRDGSVSKEINDAGCVIAHAAIVLKDATSGDAAAGKKLVKMTGEALLEHLECCFEGTFAYSTLPTSAEVLACIPEGADAVDCSWALGAVVGRRLRDAYLEERARKSLEISEALQAEEELQKLVQKPVAATASKAKKKQKQKRKGSAALVAAAGRPLLDSCLEECGVVATIEVISTTLKEVSPVEVCVEDSARSLGACTPEDDGSVAGEQSVEGETLDASSTGASAIILESSAVEPTSVEEEAPEEAAMLDAQREVETVDVETSDGPVTTASETLIVAAAPRPNRRNSRKARASRADARRELENTVALLPQSEALAAAVTPADTALPAAAAAAVPCELEGPAKEDTPLETAVDEEATLPVPVQPPLSLPPLAMDLAPPPYHTLSGAPVPMYYPFPPPSRAPAHHHHHPMPMPGPYPYLPGVPPMSLHGLAGGVPMQSMPEPVWGIPVQSQMPESMPVPAVPVTLPVALQRGQEGVRKCFYTMMRDARLRIYGQGSMPVARYELTRGAGTGSFSVQAATAFLQRRVQEVSGTAATRANIPTGGYHTVLVKRGLPLPKLQQQQQHNYGNVVNQPQAPPSASVWQSRRPAAVREQEARHSGSVMRNGRGAHSASYGNGVAPRKPFPAQPVPARGAHAGRGRQGVQPKRATAAPGPSAGDNSSHKGETPFRNASGRGEWTIQARN